jgi:hypothetical protein
MPGSAIRDGGTPHQLLAPMHPQSRHYPRGVLLRHNNLDSRRRVGSSDLNEAIMEPFAHRITVTNVNVTFPYTLNDCLRTDRNFKQHDIYV